MTINFDELRKVAEAATPGPWEWEEPSKEDWPTGDESLVQSDGNEVILMGWGYDASGIEAEQVDRAHIATFNPATVLALLTRLEQAEQQVASLKAKMDGENLRWVAWEMVENSGQVDLPVVTWINRISDGEVSLNAAKYFFFGGTAPCIHMDWGEPFDIEDEDRPACEHCNRRALDGDGRG